MQVQIELPDEIAARMGAEASEVSRRVLEAVLVEGYRAGTVHKPELMRALGIETTYELDGFLKAAGVMYEYGLEDLMRDRESLDALLANREV
jgi:hypothetical protein